MKTEKYNIKDYSLSKSWQLFLSAISLIIVACGQPARSPVLGLLAACFGYAIFWRVLFCYENAKQRFLFSTYWFTALHLIQLSWMLSHPFYYIYAPYVLFAALQGIQFGIVGILITPKNLKLVRKIVGIASFWVLMEWSRLFFLSGFSWNPVGIALTGSLESLQMASFFGVYGLSFWVFLVNLLFLRCFTGFQSSFKISKNIFVFGLFASVPYIYGFLHLALHEPKSLGYNETFAAVLIQPSFAVDEADNIRDRKVLVQHVTEQWKKILQITKKQQNQNIDLVVLPEYVVPFGTYTTVFPLETVKGIFVQVFGENILSKLPPLNDHLSQNFKGKEKDNADMVFVNNAYWLQSISNIFDAPVVAGLEDVEDISLSKRNYFSAALYFVPSCEDCLVPERYEKRVLVPLGEYIPFSFCQKLALMYGIEGSFTKGECAKVFPHPKAPFGVSICYEETFGHVMRENRQQGAELLVNLTNDGWFPNSKLTAQHFDHARLRSVESGIPLIRACNTGVTGGFDSLGRIVGMLGEPNQYDESISDSILLNIPMYTYQTIYSKYGDHFILSLSIFGIIGLLLKPRKKL